MPNNPPIIPLMDPEPSNHPGVVRMYFCSLSLKKLKYRLNKISMSPRIILIVGPSILSSSIIAAVENTTNVTIMGKKRFQVTYLIYCSITTVAEVSDRSPERVTASAYDGIRKGSAVMMNMPNPKPIVRCIKLAPAARSMIYRIFSINYFLFNSWTSLYLPKKERS